MTTTIKTTLTNRRPTPIRGAHYRGLQLSLAGLLSFTLLSPVITHAAPPVTHLEYDANGNSTKQTNGLGNAYTQQYDAINRLIQHNQPHPSTTGSQLGSTATQYNALDDVTGVTDPRSLSTTYTKNAYGEVLTLVSPDTGTTQNTYDNAGNLKTRTDARGAIATYTYDALNRLTKITHKLGTVTDETLSYFYDEGVNGKGRLTRMTDLSGSTTWNYDAAGKVTRKQQRVGNIIYDLQQQYDSAGRLSRHIYPSGRYIDYGYNLNGQINQVAVDGQVMLSNIVYHPTGHIKSYNWGNGKTYSQSVDDSGRPISMTMGTEQQVITYDNAGRITQIYHALPATPTTPIAGTTSTYAYDNVDRLTSQVTSTTSTSYQYDLSHNRTALIVGANSYPYSIAATSNRLMTEAGPTARTYTYTTDGSIAGNGQDTYTYYNSGRLKQVTRPITTNGVTTNTNIYALRYNGLGQFVHRTNGNLYYLYDGAGHLLGEYNSASDVLQETVYLGDTPILTLRPSSQNRTADNNSTTATNKATVTGTWTAATAIKGYYGSNYHSHAATPVGQTTTDNILYTITPTATQSFKVYARWIAQATNATNASYTIAPNTAGSTPTTITVDQTQNGGTWNYLGSYALNTANPMTVTLSGQGNGIVIADAIRIVPDTATQVQNNTYFVHTDHLNTPRVIVNRDNQRRWTWYPENSEAFGANVPNENPNTPALGTFTYNLRFPGQFYDPTSQLSYNYYRDYNPRTGRYIESDPIGLEGGINTYAYVGGNPLSASDSQGLAATIDAGNGYGGGYSGWSSGPGLGVGGRSGGGLGALGVAGAAAAVAIANSCKSGNCPPCEPYAVGDIGYTGPRLTENGKDGVRTNGGIGVYHYKLYAVYQDARDCSCHWRHTRDVKSKYGHHVALPPSGAHDLNSNPVIGNAPSYP